jgi:hypothetical protein
MKVVSIYSHKVPFLYVLHLSNVPYIYVCMYVFMYVCMYVCCECMYVCVYIQVRLQWLRTICSII